MKPNWKDAPKWAKYLAMDENGLWCWFENEPYKTMDDDIGIWLHETGRFLPVDLFENWGKTLEERPEND